MDETALEKHLSEVPSVIINAVNPLSDRKCWGIYIALLRTDEGLRFNQIKELFSAESSEVSRALKKLANAGLIAKKVHAIEDLGTGEAAYYVSTPLGKNLLRSLYEGLLPAKDSPDVQRDVNRASLCYAGVPSRKPSRVGIHDSARTPRPHASLSSRQVRK